MSVLITAMAGILLLALGVQVGMWLAPSTQRRGSLQSFLRFGEHSKVNRPLVESTSENGTTPLWDTIGSEAYWKTPQGQAHLKDEIKRAAADVDSVMEALNTVTASPNTVRAVMICLPRDGGDKRNRELRALYLSWLLALSEEPPHLRTDLVIFTDERAADLAAGLGCVRDVRHDFSTPSRCVIAPYTRLEDRTRSPSQPEDPLVRYSGYMNSILSFAEYDGYAYDLVLRTDTDVFVMPGFYNWTLPSDVNIVVGLGGYSVENNDAHLLYVSKTLGLRNEFNHRNVGSTWFARLTLARAAARLSVAAARWLIAEEYSEYEKCCAGILGWPHWHWGVVTMYSGHLALNHIASFAKSGDGHGNLDVGAASSDLVSDPMVKHVHCWHSNDRFSKFEHENGAYDSYNLTPYMEMAVIKDFALVVAVTSLRLTQTEFKDFSSNPGTLRNRSSWLRLLP
ncbi:hypothetical protein Pmar_PMAR026023 [Perkinsus marinus ATCC 50983]|uniref:DUF7164 domain-containing protein n=1 Tax=Perkinsus marinus (strain ATCC 50983 / TXsc) TaxID=423536 RepID=C5LK77_PERM5|nr:hypothetical protein Pmar_PMAR026023 [Perkinsus marinus ATCC 50983]EER02864.1 hypothetical protein Pmar_PMAR026023 [Perkinsus marinus ATCC 50983]|eukprot:XP_002771048.1 hypothetical protein Pmar_PMAR026023 [Perkinsus marinus ATCC 50983]